MKPLIINFFGGPGSGKSTLAAGLYHILKVNSYDVELVVEFAKEKVHEDNWTAIKFQPYVTGGQIYRQYLAEQKYKIVINDSPFILGAIYDKEENDEIKQSYKTFLFKTFANKNNLNYFINRRTDDWHQIGRIHTLNESIIKDEEIKNLLLENNINFELIDCDQNSIVRIFTEFKNKYTK